MEEITKIKTLKHRSQCVLNIIINYIIINYIIYVIINY